MGNFILYEGVSFYLKICARSGITMTTDLFAGLSKEAAARFSFLLSTPIIFGAGMLELKNIIHTSISIAGNFIVGMIVAAIVGFLCIKYLLNYLRNHGFGVFVVYRFIVGIIFITVYILK